MKQITKINIKEFWKGYKLGTLKTIYYCSILMVFIIFIKILIWGINTFN